MPDASKRVFFARNMPDVLSQLASVEDLRVMAGCTQSAVMPKTSLIVRGVEDLLAIERRERFMDIGSAVPLSVILERGQKRVPKTLYDAIKSTATPFVRNAATLGGNICAEGNKRSLFAPLYALDCLLEFKNEKQMISMQISQFERAPPKSLLTKIRVPLNEWDVAIYKRLGPTGRDCGQNAYFVFLAMTQKGFLSDIRIVFSSTTVFRDRTLENNMIGTLLPLSRKNVELFAEQTLKSFAPQSDSRIPELDEEGRETPPDEKAIFDSRLAERQFFNLLLCSLEQLT
jgi:CO/xanthine dehydrogenase FAD-binding subunit